MEPNTVLGWRRSRRDRAAQDESDAQLLAGPPALRLFSAAGPPPRIRPIAPVVWVPDNEPPKVTLAQIGTEPVELCPPVTCQLPAAMWFSNAQGFPASPGRHERTASASAISLVRLPPDTVVFGGGQCVVSCGDYFLAEQFPPDAACDHAIIDSIAPFYDLPVVETEQEVLLVARFGIAARGPWLCELLPKILLAERAFPERFAFLLPAEILQSADPQARGSTIAQSLQACGIDLSRVYPVAPDVTYRFAALHAVTPVWSDAIMHPHAAEALRQACAHIPAAGHRRIAILPETGSDPIVHNADEIDGILGAHGFFPLQASALPVTDQIATFKAVSTLFAPLGFDCGNLIFAPPGVRVITVAAQGADERLCFGLVLDRQGHMADLRGRVEDTDEPSGQARLSLDLATLLTALDTIPA